MTPSPVKLSPRLLSLALLFSFVLASPLLSAQVLSAADSPTEIKPGAPPTLRFEVASIRPHRSANDESSNRRMLPGGRFVATATSVRTLIRIAFATDDNRISGAPAWIGDDLFDIDAVTVDHAEVDTPQQFQQLLLSLLEDRFEFKFHVQPAEAPVYWLILDKPGKVGSALKPSTATSQPNLSSNSNGAVTTMKASKMSMADVAAALGRQAGRPVEDHTGLQGNFDFQIKWSPEEIPDASDPSLFTVLKEQLGLKLRPAKGATTMLVIRQISHPTAN